MSTPLTTRIPIKDANGTVIGEKEVATYAGLLARAHEEGLSEIRTEVVQVPVADNGGVAIVSARVTTKKGNFAGIGDASERSVTRRIVPHLIRMAETRAKARALRDAVNIGVVALDELGDEVADAPDNGGPPPGTATPPPSGTNGHPRQPTQANGYQNGHANGNGAPNGTARPNGNVHRGTFIRMTEPQRRLVCRLVAEAGYDGEGIEQEICRRANVASIAAISKGKASELIENMKGAGRPNGVAHA